MYYWSGGKEIIQRTESISGRRGPGRRIFGSNSSPKNFRSILILSNFNIFWKFLIIIIDINQYFNLFFVEKNHMYFWSGGKEIFNVRQIEFVAIKLSINTNFVKSSYFLRILDYCNRYRSIFQTFFCRIWLYLLLKRGQRNVLSYVTKIKRKVPITWCGILANLVIFQYIIDNYINNRDIIK